jgi:hypothetical protein
VDLGKAAAVQGARFESRSTSPAERAFHEEEGKGMTQILVAFEDEYRVYRDAIARSLRLYRPHVEVAVADLDKLGDEVARLDPELVVCSRPNTVEPNGRPAWFELSPTPDQLAEICINGEHFKTTNPALEELLRVVDETERLARTGLPFP